MVISHVQSVAGLSSYSQFNTKLGLEALLIRFEAQQVTIPESYHIMVLLGLLISL